MPRVVVEYMLRFRDIVGRGRDEVLLEEGATVSDLINLLQRMYGDELEKEFRNPSGDEVGGNVLIILNDRVVTDKELGTVLKDGDVVTLTYVVFGG